MNDLIHFFWRKLFEKSSRKLFKFRKKIRHYEPSVIFSHDNSICNDFLVDLYIQSIKKAWDSKLILPRKAMQDTIYLNICPGEHYRMLHAITMILNPGLVIEIGTYTGLGSIAFSQGLTRGRIITFDIVPWKNFPTSLTQDDFDNHIIEQRIADLSDVYQFEKNIDVLDNADIIFIDGPKDGNFEYKFLSLICKLSPRKNKLLIIDDIHFLNMIDLWVSIESPKLDISSFGHWSGTGLVDISKPLQINVQLN